MYIDICIYTGTYQIQFPHTPIGACVLRSFFRGFQNSDISRSGALSVLETNPKLSGAVDIMALYNLERLRRQITWFRKPQGARKGPGAVNAGACKHAAAIGTINGGV